MTKGGQPWTWIDGSAFDFTPQIGYNDNGCMTLLSAGTDYPWNDRRCSATFPFICKMRG